MAVDTGSVQVERLRRRLASQDVDMGCRASVRTAVAKVLVTDGTALSSADLAATVRDLTDHLVGLGPLEVLLRRVGVTDVLVNAPDQVWVEQDARLHRTDVSFPDAESVLAAVRRVAAVHGGRLDPTSPFVDVHLPDGSRLHAVGTPIITGCPLVTIRRFDVRLQSWTQLAASGAVPDAAAACIRQALALRQAIVVCGRTGTGKTTLLQRLLSYVGVDGVVLIVVAVELRPSTPHLVRLRTRPAGPEGTGAVDIATLVRQALRMRPDRIVVGEVRGVEVADVLQALITGHEGCMTTVHARSADQALLRLEGMALQAGLPLQAVRSQIISAVDLVVALDRGPDGTRGVVQVAQVVGQAGLPVARTLWERVGW